MAMSIFFWLVRKSEMTLFELVDFFITFISICLFAS